MNQNNELQKILEDSEMLKAWALQAPAHAKNVRSGATLFFMLAAVFVIDLIYAAAKCYFWNDPVDLIEKGCFLLFATLAGAQATGLLLRATWVQEHPIDWAAEDLSEKMIEQFKESINK